MSLGRHLQVLGVALIGSCLVLPMSTCMGSPQYIATEIEGDPVTWLWGAAMAWPALLILATRMWPEIARRSFWLEPAGVVGTSYVVAIFSNPLVQVGIGCVAGCLGVLTYSISWLARLRESLIPASVRAG